MAKIQFRKVPSYILNNMEEDGFATTIGECIQLIFPYGSRNEIDYGNKGEVSNGKDYWIHHPFSPQDIFAIVGYLLNQSGAFSFYGISPNISYRDYPKLSLSDDEKIEVISAGDEWNNKLSNVPPQVSKLWNDLLTYWDFPLQKYAYRKDPLITENNQFWWNVAYKLFILSDQACKDIGFEKHTDNRDSVSGEFLYARKTIIHFQNKNNKKHISPLKLRGTIANTAHPDFVCVQPKSLVPTVGSGTRAFSQNLALLPARGVVHTQWATPLYKSEAMKDSGLNVLVIPLPYEFDKDEFISTNIPDTALDKDIFTFKLKQSWLKNPWPNFLANTMKIIQKCHEKHDKLIHTVILPELALNKAKFNEFSDYVKNAIPELELIISGSSENCENTPSTEGNFIWIRHFIAKPGLEGDDGYEKLVVRHRKNDKFIDISQSKHHRWKLDKEQIKEYHLHKGHDGLGLSDNPHWENLAGRSRELNFLAIREKSTICAIVCEDLARNEPCHELIKSVGPNLVISLLMDGAQISKRWGAKYSSIFTEDHGAAAMTVNSRALVYRSIPNHIKKQQSHSVVFFKSPVNNKEYSLECTNNHSAIFIRLEPEKLTRRSIDGRQKKTHEWVLKENFLHTRDNKEFNYLIDSKEN